MLKGTLRDISDQNLIKIGIANNYKNNIRGVLLEKGIC